MKVIDDEYIVLNKSIQGLECLVCGWKEKWDELGNHTVDIEIDDHVFDVHSLRWDESQWVQKQRVMR